jgi:hypothetical protein
MDEEESKLNIYPFSICRTACLPNRFSKLDLPAVLGRRAGEYSDVPGISSEARKKQIIGQAKTEVIRILKKTK